MEKKKYDIVDSIFSIFIVVSLFFGYVFLRNTYYSLNNVSEELLLFSQLIFSLVFIIIIIVYMIIRKQKPHTIGITKKNLKKSLLLGLLTSGLYLIIFLIIHLIQDDFNIQNNILGIFISIIYFLVFVAFFEEIIFRGFISSRMECLLKNEYLTIIVVAILFSLLHIPFNSMGFYGTMKEYFINYGGYHIALCFLHIVFKFLYDKFNNILAPTVFHFIYNYILWFFIGIN